MTTQQTIKLRGDRFGPDNLRIWQIIDFCEDFDERPSVVRATIEALGIEAKHDYGPHARLYDAAAFKRLKQHFQDKQDLDE